MMKTKTILFMLMLLVGFTSVGVTPTIAQSAPPTSNPRQERRQERIADRCTIVTSRIDNRINVHYAKKDDIVARYQRVIDRVQAAGEKLEAKGYDITKISEDLKVLNQKNVKIGQDYASFISKLEATKQYACGQSEGAFREALDSANLQLQTVKTDVADAKSYYLTVIKADLEALRNQNPNLLP